MRPKIQRFFMLLAALLLCLSGCGKKDLFITGSSDILAVAAGQSWFYYQQQDEISAVNSQTQKVHRLGQGFLTGSDDRYVYLWQNSDQIAVLEGIRTLAAFDCPTAPAYWGTADGCAYFTATDQNQEKISYLLYVLDLSGMELRQYPLSGIPEAVAAEGEQIYYIGYWAQDLRLCRYDLANAQEQVLPESGSFTDESALFCLEGELYYAGKTAFCRLSPDDLQEEVLWEAEEIPDAVYSGNLACLRYKKGEEQFLWIYDMRERRVLSNEAAAIEKLYQSAFGLIYAQGQEYWLDGAAARAFIDARNPIDQIDGSPAGFIASTGEGELFIAFLQPNGSYETKQLIEAFH